MAASDLIISGVRWLRDATGALVGYRHPVTDADVPINLSGGATTYAALTDAASVDLPATNTALTNALNAKAALASPTFTGTPAAPTAAAATNTTQIATTAHVFAERTNTATLTNKTISGVSNTLSAIPQSAVTNLATDLAAKADVLSVVDVTGNFTLTSAHANRRVDAASGSAIAVTWDTGHGMTKGACGRIVQTGAGAVTLSAGTGAVTLSPNVSAASTTADGSYLDWEYLGSDELLITARGAVVTTAPSNILTGTPGTVAFGGGNNQVATRIAIPANTLSATGILRISVVTRKSGLTDTAVFQVRAVATGAAMTTGTQIATQNFAAGTRALLQSVWVSGNGSDQTTMQGAVAGATATGLFTDANAPSIALPSSSAFDIIIGGNPGATADSWSVLSAKVEVL